MAVLNIYRGCQNWPDYVAGQPGIKVFERAVQGRAIYSDSGGQTGCGSLIVGLSSGDYKIAVESGLGAIGGGIAWVEEKSATSVDFPFDKLAGGVEALNADFNLLIGDLIWKLQMRQAHLNNVLAEVRLPEFEREARAFRTRAERAYLNGWYEEALPDFMEAAKRNYPDFAVHRSIASILLYYLMDVPGALEYFRKSARYARASDAHQAAEAHYFAAMICIMERRLPEGLSHLDQALSLNPRLLDAYYHRAALAAMAGDFAAAMTDLEPAVKGDPRYFDRAGREPVFDGIHQELEALLDRLLGPAREKAEQIRREREELKNYVIVNEEEEQISHLFEELEEQTSGTRTFMAAPGFLDTLSRAQQEIAGIYDRFHKQYEIDPRDYVRSIAFSPNGRLLASGFLHGGISVWDVDSGLDVLSLVGHLASVNSVAFSPDSQLLATGSRDKTIKLWDVAARHPLLNLIGHRDEVSAVAFSPDGRWLASASHDRTVRIWRVETGREVQSLLGHSGKVTAALFSPSGKLLATGSSDRTVKLWGVGTGEALLTLKGHTKGVASLAFSPDGKLLASGGDDANVKVWDIGTGSVAQTLKGLRYSVTSMAFSPDGRLLAAGSLGQTIMLWKLDTALAIKSLRYSDISYNSVAFSPHGEWLAFGSRDLQLWLKAVLTSEQYATVKAGEDRALTAKMGADSTAPAKHLFASFDEAEPLQHGFCEVCSKKLGRFERLFRDRCKIHRVSRARR
ncbi:MAG TPA: hypothetical protein VJX67_18835 [Blastocatellia bacterium]|nr:hypothetical protein [Blastocatellia bacterium]